MFGGPWEGIRRSLRRKCVGAFVVPFWCPLHPQHRQRRQASPFKALVHKLHGMPAKADGIALSRANGSSNHSPPRKARFSLSDSRASSAPSSRSSSPGPYGYDEKRLSSVSGTNLDSDDDLTPGRLARDVYEATLPKWRAAVRRRLVAAVEVESKVIAKMQVWPIATFSNGVIYAFQKFIRTPWLDAYFVYTSSLGTHTFFMIMLPAFFFFGGNELGRGFVENSLYAHVSDIP